MKFSLYAMFQPQSCSQVPLHAYFQNNHGVISTFQSRNSILKRTQFHVQTIITNLVFSSCSDPHYKLGTKYSCTFSHAFIYQFSYVIMHQTCLLTARNLVHQNIQPCIHKSIIMHQICMNSSYQSCIRHTCSVCYIQIFSHVIHDIMFQLFMFSMYVSSSSSLSLSLIPG